MPREDHVMRIAQNWSICPRGSPDSAVPDLSVEYHSVRQDAYVDRADSVRMEQ
jgi:hypothetical protein